MFWRFADQVFNMVFCRSQWTWCILMFHRLSTLRVWLRTASVLAISHFATETMAYPMECQVVVDIATARQPQLTVGNSTQMESEMLGIMCHGTNPINRDQKYNLFGGFNHFFIFHNIWDNPSRWLIFFKMLKTTNQTIICINMHKLQRPHMNLRHWNDWLVYGYLSPWMTCFHMFFRRPASTIYDLSWYSWWMTGVEGRRICIALRYLHLTLF